MAKVRSDGSQEVVTATVDSLAGICQGHFDRTKMDIEGAEVEAMKRAKHSLPLCQQLAVEAHGASKLASVEALC